MHLQCAIYFIAVILLEFCFNLHVSGNWLLRDILPPINGVGFLCVMRLPHPAKDVFYRFSVPRELPPSCLEFALREAVENLIAHQNFVLFFPLINWWQGRPWWSFCKWISINLSGARRCISGEPLTKDKYENHKENKKYNTLYNFRDWF